MNNYTTSSLGSLARVINGRAYKQEELLDSGKYRVLRVGNFFSNGSWYYSDLELDKDKYCESGDLLFAWSASFGPKIWDGEKVIYHYHIWKIVENSELIDRKFLYYFLLNSVKGMMASTHGSIMLHLTKEFMERLPVHLPNDIRTQKNIADILSVIDGKIDCNNRINKELESMAKTLYDYWFVQFDFPNKDGKPYKSSGGEMIYNDELKRSIPKGWANCSLEEHITFKRGISYKSSDIQDSGIPFLNLNSFSLKGEFKPDGTKFFNGKYKNNALLNTGDLVIAITDVTRNADIIGKAFVLGDFFDQKPLISCDVASVSSDTFGAYYLEQLFNSNQYHSYIKHFASGTLVLHLDLNGVNWYKSFIPASDILSKFEEICKTIFQHRDTALKENFQLNALRDWLLPMLMNGQVTAS